MTNRLRNKALLGAVLELFLAVVGAGAITIGLSSWSWGWPLALKAASRPVASHNVSPASLSKQDGSVTSFAPVVRQVAPSVVYVYSNTTVRSNVREDLRPLFADPFGENSNQWKSRTQKQRGLGSGVIISKDGHIITNNHVVEGADEIKVRLFSHQRDYTAQVIGRDAKTDIAVLKIDAADLLPARFARRDEIEAGDVVLAVGSPCGIGQTVTMGIVNSPPRGSVGMEEYEDFIQTDAAINPGISGGALVDTAGRLVGICTAIASSGAGSRGVNFAVPVELVRNVVDQILKRGRVIRGYLGVSVQEFTPELRRRFSIPEGCGALVGGVTVGSAAEKAGLKGGDVIFDFNGARVEDSHSLKLLVGKAAPGEKVTFKILRGGMEKTLTAYLQEMSEKSLPRGRGAGNAADEESVPGLTVTDIDAEARKNLDLPENLVGALISDIHPDSAAYEAGLRMGDVIQEINRKPIGNAEEAVILSKNLQGERMVLRIWRRGATRFIIAGECQES